MKVRCFAVIAAVWALCCPLTASSAPVSAAIGRHLDHDGIEYSVSTGRAWRLAIDRLEVIFEDMVWRNQLADGDRRELLSWLTGWRLWRELSGIEYAEGTGRSSKEIDDNFIHNREFLALSPSAPGLINELLGKNVISPVKFCRSLPVGTELAISIELHPAALISALGKCGSFGEKIAGLFPSALPVPELAADAGGIWEVILFRAGDALHWRLELPDRNGRIFALAGVVQVRPQFKSADRVVTDIDLQNMENAVVGGGMVAVRKPGRLVIFSTPAAERAFMASPLPVIPEKYSGLFSRMPEKAAAVVFCGATESYNDDTDFGGLKIRTANGFPSLAAVVREKDGLLAVDNGKSSCMLSDILLLLDMHSLLKDLKLKSDVSDPPDKTPGAKPRKAAAVRCNCREKLLIAKSEVQETPCAAGFYIAEKRNGKTVVAPVKKGQHQLVSFGKISSAKPVPLFICVPHGNSFCALLSNGEVKCFELDEITGYRRIVGYLHTVYMYDEAVFGKLMETAAGLDEK